MTDKDSNLLKLLKTRMFKVRESGEQLEKSRPLISRTINEMMGDISYVEALLDLNEINLKKNHDYLLLKEGLLRAITTYQSGVDLIVERAKKGRDKEERNYSQKIRELD